MAKKPDEKMQDVWLTPQDIPEYYTNSINLGVSVFDVTFLVGLSDIDGSSTPKLKLRMSLQHAWIFSKILEKTMKAYVEKAGKISIPEEFLREKGLLELYQEEFGGR